MSSQKPFSRTATDLGNGTLGVSIPRELAEQFDVEQGDEIALERDGDRVTYILGD